MLKRQPIQIQNSLDYSEMIFSVRSHSSEQTKTIGKAFSKIFSPGEVILLSGELGTGKTTFVGGIAVGLGIKECLSSPSFTIINLYKISNRRIFVHADFYRLDNLIQVLNTGIEDYLYKANIYVAIEWGTKMKDYLNNNILEIEIEYIKDQNVFQNERNIIFNDRNIIFKSSSLRWDKKLNILKKIVDKK